MEAPTPRFYEIESSERTGANSYFSYYTPTGRHISTEMACYQHKANFMAEINRLVDQGERDRKIVEMVRQDRHCEAWYPYRPGFSPQEHYEEMRMQRLEHDRQTLQLRLSDLERTAQRESNQIAEASNTAISEMRDLTSELREMAKANDKFTRRVTIFVVALAAIQALSAVLTLPSLAWVQKLWRLLFG